MTYPYEPPTGTIRELLTAAIRQGFGPDAIGDVDEGEDRTLVFVGGFEDPIEIRPDGMTIPGCFPSRTAEAIQRDVDAVLAAQNGRGVSA